MNRREFCKAASVVGGAAVLSPLFSACRGQQVTAPSTNTPTTMTPRPTPGELPLTAPEPGQRDPLLFFYHMCVHADGPIPRTTDRSPKRKIGGALNAARAARPIIPSLLLNVNNS